jgi:autotransporter-associated beta strand protein
MKHLSSKSLRFIPAALGLAVALLANNAMAATSLYFDVNGATAGSGVANGGSYNWDGTSWSTSSGLAVAGTTWAAGDFARFTTSVAGYSVNTTASESMAGLYNTQSAATLTINGSGAGALNITTTGGTVYTSGSDSLNVQGFLCTGPVVINAPITGAGGISQGGGSASLTLNGVNTYAGGTATTGGQLIYYNNNSSFGTGPIYIGGSGNALVSSAATPITIANTVIFPTANYNLNLAGGTPSTTYSGRFTLPATGTTTLNTSSTATEVTKITGVISGTSALTVADYGTLVLSGANTYTGPTTVSSINGPVTLKLGAANTIASSSGLVLNGTTTFNPGGFNQAMASTTLTLTAPALTATIDFGAGASEVDLANSSALAWTGVLNLANWNQSVDALRIGPDGTGLTSAQLNDITFNGTDGGDAAINASGYIYDITMVPEPSTALLGLLGGLSVMWTYRRRTV